MSENSLVVTALPEGFTDLEPFVEAWSISGLVNRAARRDVSTPAERLVFYDGLKHRVADILDYVGDKPLSALNGEEERLLNLALSYGHVALAIEIQGDSEPEHAGSRTLMKIGQP